jgi:hypothetical protein
MDACMECVYSDEGAKIGDQNSFLTKNKGSNIG